MGLYSLVNIMLVALSIFVPGWIGIWAIFLTSFFMSLMFDFGKMVWALRRFWWSGLSGKHPELANQRLFKGDFLIFRDGVVTALASLTVGTSGTARVDAHAYRLQYREGKSLSRLRTSFGQRA